MSTTMVDEKVSSYLPPLPKLHRRSHPVELIRKESLLAFERQNGVAVALAD